MDVSVSAALGATHASMISRGRVKHTIRIDGCFAQAVCRDRGKACGTHSRTMGGLRAAITGSRPRCRLFSDCRPIDAFGTGHAAITKSITALTCRCVLQTGLVRRVRSITVHSDAPPSEWHLAATLVLPAPTIAVPW